MELNENSARLEARPGPRESSDNNAVDTSGSPISATEALGVPTQTSNISTPISRAEEGVKVKTGELAKLLSDLRAVRAHHAFTRDRIGQPGCEVRLVAAEYVETIDAAIEALTPAPQGAA